MKRLRSAAPYIAAAFAVLCLFAISNSGINRHVSRWYYQHLMSVDEKVRRFNDSFPWSSGAGMEIFYPGGSGILPYSGEIITIESFDPFRLVLQDEETGDIRRMLQVADGLFQFTAKSAPIEITIQVVDVYADGCRFMAKASKKTL